MPKVRKMSDATTGFTLGWADFKGAVGYVIAVLVSAVLSLVHGNVKKIESRVDDLEHNNASKAELKTAVDGVQAGIARIETQVNILINSFVVTKK